jgi:hypothetical protein
MDINKVDLLLKYILAATGQEDFGNREVGPIHLVKYVYLADLAFAEKHGGETFTGAPRGFKESFRCRGTLSDSFNKEKEGGYEGP